MPNDVTSYPSILSPFQIKPNEVTALVNSTWPPAYVTRISARAKRISLLITSKRGLEVVLPKRKRPLPLSCIEAVLQEHQPWIQKQLAAWQLEQQHRQHLSILPDSLTFPAFEKEIRLEYQKTPSKQLRGKICLQDSQKFLLRGDVDTVPKVIHLLKKFLFLEAQRLLIPRLQDLSLITGLSFSAAKIRSQTTLWGSCTATKNISLNVRLLFLPKALVDYVLLHELCHTRHLNHSEKFWQLLKIFDPNCLEHRRLLRKISPLLPSWMPH